MGSASIRSSAARPAPASRGKVQDTPVSAASPTRAKAIRKLAPWAAMRRSHAKASPAPAPAATPFTAAMTGLGMDRMASTSGL